MADDYRHPDGGRYFVPMEPTDVAGRLFVVVMPDSFLPLVCCPDEMVAVRIAHLINQHGLTDDDPEEKFNGQAPA